MQTLFTMMDVLFERVFDSEPFEAKVAPQFIYGPAGSNSFIIKLTK